VIQKGKLFNKISHDFARRECSVQAALSHENVIKLYDYTETGSEYQLFLEYADQAGYLSDKILNV